ncbi:hypothetical protein BI344_18055 [Chromobacterium sphagni]|uniref:Uncharacterized protein n=1 Tax=Chromobacterium sphagni TaxID=1903179 RepID=A0ABX3CBA6_9NEIS|nr:hypothetical protein BI344_18055 [Chromobacterium sphagni]
MAARSPIVFAKWWAPETSLQQLDEVLWIALRMQPSEIDGLEMVDYWWWVEVAEREIKRRSA